MTSSSLILCHKVRNPETGALSSPVVLNEKLLEFALKDINSQFIVVDDIIDGGGTFIQLGKKLVEEYGVSTGNLHLFATHGIFSKGLDNLRKYYRTIGCYHTLSSDIEKLDNLIVVERFF
jgi:ribose-phosphate pyrophosphokinase